jgi:aspartate/methionine/tyrosine aminotransferase
MTERTTPIAGHVNAVGISAIKEMALLASAMEDVASLSWGLPSFQTPEPIRKAVAGALSTDPDIGKYALPDGLPELRNLVAEHHRATTGVTVSPDRNVFITAGNMQGMSTLLHVLIEPGDEIIVTDPGFASHSQQIRLRGGSPVFWPLEEAEGWAMNTNTLAGLITGRTKALILVNPSNPTGSLFARDDLLRVGQIARDHDLMVLLDDPYSELVYDDRARPFNLAADENLAERVAYLFTFSKIHAMSGWRLGYMIIPEWLRSSVLKVHDANMICTPRISQVAGMAALSEETGHVDRFREILNQRRTLICERLDALPDLFSYHRPAGAYYVFPRIEADHQDSRDFSLRLLHEARVSVTPGVGFGPSGDHHVRMAFCVSESEINRAFDRIEAWFRQNV